MKSAIDPEAAPFIDKLEDVRTEKHYVHLRRDLFSPRDHPAMAVDLAPSGASTATLPSSVRRQTGSGDHQELTEPQQ